MAGRRCFVTHTKFRWISKTVPNRNSESCAGLRAHSAISSVMASLANSQDFIGLFEPQMTVTGFSAAHASVEVPRLQVKGEDIGKQRTQGAGYLLDCITAQLGCRFFLEYHFEYGQISKRPIPASLRRAPYTIAPPSVTRRAEFATNQAPPETSRDRRPGR